MQKGIKWNIQGNFNVDLNLGTTRNNPTLINSCPMATSNFALKWCWHYNDKEFAVFQSNNNGSKTIDVLYIHLCCTPNK